MRVALRKRAFRGGHYFFRSTPQSFGKASQELKVAPREAFRPAATNKFDAPILADFRTAADEEHTDLAGALDVGAAAGLQIGRLYFDGTEDAVAVDFFSHADLCQLLRGAVADVHPPILEDNLICGPLRAFKNFLGRFGAAQVNRADFRPEMEGDRGQAEAFLKHGRQQMLAGVLLHVVETAGPVDAALDLAEFHGSINDVEDSVLGIADIDYVGITQLAEIVRLATGRRIEGGSMQDDVPSRSLGHREGRNQSRLRTYDSCGEFRFECVVVIEPTRGHAATPLAPTGAHAARLRCIYSRCRY